MQLCAALWLQDCSYPWTCGEHGTSFECGCNCDLSWVPDMNAHYSPFQYCNVYMYDQDDSGAAVYFAQNQVPPGTSPASHPALLPASSQGTCGRLNTARPIQPSTRLQASHKCCCVYIQPSLASRLVLGIAVSTSACDRRFHRLNHGLTMLIPTQFGAVTCACLISKHTCALRLSGSNAGRRTPWTSTTELSLQ